MEMKTVSVVSSVSRTSGTGNVKFRELKHLNTLPKINDAINSEIRKENPDVNRLQFLNDKKEILEKYPNTNHLSFAELLKSEMDNSSEKTRYGKTVKTQFAEQPETFDIHETLRISFSVINKIIASQEFNTTTYSTAFQSVKFRSLLENTAPNFTTSAVSL